jgi:hypothetical protein
MCSLLVEKPLMMGGLLAFVGGTLLKELLATIGLLALTSGFLVKMALAGRRLEAMVLVLPQLAHGLFPVLVGGLLMSATSGKNSLPMEEAGAAPRLGGLCAGRNWSNRLGRCGPSQ